MSGEKMQSQRTIEALHALDVYYKNSFCLTTEENTVNLLRLIDCLEQVLRVHDDNRLSSILLLKLKDVMDAMTANDYVLVRDLLYYDVKKILQEW